MIISGSIEHFFFFFLIIFPLTFSLSFFCFFLFIFSCSTGLFVSIILRSFGICSWNCNNVRLFTSDNKYCENLECSLALCFDTLLKPNQSKTKLEYLLHFYAIKKMSYPYVFSDKRKLHLKWRETLSKRKKKKKKNLFNQKCIFLSKKIWSRNFSASSFLFPVYSPGIKLLIPNRRKRAKILKSYF